LWFCFLPDSSGRSGVSYWDGNSFANFWLGTPQNNINNIFVDSQNNKWFSTTEGVTIFDDQNSSSEFNTSNSFLSANNVRSSVRDQNGNVWITTIGGGLNKYKPPR
jgi:ligand-binding sensor domain-containing protein